MTTPMSDEFANGEHILQFFAYKHLPEKLQNVSKPFCELAGVIVATLPRNSERTVSLRKLLEAKDAAVRALIAKKTERIDVDKVSCPHCKSLDYSSLDCPETNYDFHQCNRCHCEWKVPNINNHDTFQIIIVHEGNP
jgi:hypothetical protein